MKDLAPAQDDSGQRLFDFAPRRARILELSQALGGSGSTADDLYDAGCDLERTSPSRAALAYRAALARDPRHPDALTNLGRLLHAAGDVEGARERFRRALAARPDDTVALFNLAVALGDLGRTAEAVRAYERVLAIDPGFADAGFNLGLLYERLGQRTRAFRHLAAYRRGALAR